MQWIVNLFKDNFLPYFIVPIAVIIFAATRGAHVFMTGCARGGTGLFGIIQNWWRQFVEMLYLIRAADDVLFGFLRVVVVMGFCASISLGILCVGRW